MNAPPAHLVKFRKPKKYDRNLVAIGGGAAGLVTSYIGATVGAKVTLIEKNKMGGDCLNTGCVPSKALIRSARIMNYLKRSPEFGLRHEGVQVEFSQVMARVQKTIAKIEPHDSPRRYRELGVECLFGEAKLTSPYSVKVNDVELFPKNIVLATGASPFVPPIPGINEVGYLTSDTLWGLKQLPERMVILGGGPIGCELAQAFSRFGCKVTLLEIAPSILIREDPEVIQAVEKGLLLDGVDIRTRCQVEKVASNGGEIMLSISIDGKQETLRSDELLLAVGRKANVEGFGLEEIGIELTDRGSIKTNAYLQTNYKNIFACGDVAGPYQFTHMAGHQAWYASVNALFRGIKKFPVDYKVVPAATFTDPEVARVGLNEKEAKQRNIPYEVTHYGIDDLDRAICDGEDKGFVKVLTKPGKDKILGVTIVGYHAAEVIAEFVLAMKHGLGMNKVLGTIHIYPTLTEANKYAAGEWKKAHAPEQLLKWVERFHRWRLS